MLRTRICPENSVLALGRVRLLVKRQTQVLIELKCLSLREIPGEADACPKFFGRNAHEGTGDPRLMSYQRISLSRST